MARGSIYGLTPGPGREGVAGEECATLREGSASTCSRRGTAVTPPRVISTASLALAAGIVPVFLATALSPLIAAELRFAEAAVATAVTCFFLGAAVSALPAGRLAERMSGRAAMLCGLLVSAVGSLALGIVAKTWWHLATMLVLMGAVVPLIDAGAARTFAMSLPEQKRAIAFGVKESCVPLAAMLAGLAVPIVSGSIGWRGAYIAVPVLGLFAALALPRAAEVAAGDAMSFVVGAPGRSAGTRSPSLPRRSWLLVVAISLASGSATASVAFLVPAASRAGFSSSQAGALLATASAGSIVVRLVSGHVADRRRDLLPTTFVGSILIGGLGTSWIAALSDAIAAPSLVFGLAMWLTVAAGWGWTGLAFLALTDAVPHAPAYAASAGMLGLSVGGTGGPLLFGIVATAASYRWAWACLGALFLIAGCLAKKGLRKPVTQLASESRLPDGPG